MLTQKSYNDRNSTWLTVVHLGPHIQQLHVQHQPNDFTTFISTIHVLTAELLARLREKERSFLDCEIDGVCIDNHVFYA